MKDSKSNFKSKFKKVTTVISWIIFAVLIILAALLIYYFVAMKIYAKRGRGYEPAFSLYTIISPSMDPNIKVYDVVINTKVKSPKDIKIGDIITFNSTDFEIGKSISVTHRVVEILVDSKGHYSYSTKGDNNMMKDPKPVPFESITGKVSVVVPQLGQLQFFVASRAGWLLVVVVPALFILIKDILKVLRIISPDPKKTKNILFMPIKRKQLYLPLHGYVNSEGEKQKFSVSSLIPFTFDRGIEIDEEAEKLKRQTTLEDIYSDLDTISNKK